MRFIIVILIIITVLLTACNQKNTDETIVCPALYEPVCGNDEITYGNSCEAEKAGITEYTQGECVIEENESEEPVIEVCPAIYDPVCGNDNITYSNSCEAEKAGVMNYVSGECIVHNNSINETILIEEECPTFYNPVCGNNNFTYANSCEAEKAGITEYTQGRCIVIDNQDTECPTSFKPVCGQKNNNIINYDNLCLLNADDAIFLYEGECKDTSLDYYENIDYSIDMDYFIGYWQYEVYLEKPTACHQVNVSRTVSEDTIPVIAAVHIRILEPANENCGASTRIEQVRGFVESDLDTIVKVYLEGNVIFESSQ